MGGVPGRGGGGGGWEGLLIVGQHFTCYRAVATRHHRISAIPRIQIAVSQFPFSSKVQQGLCVSHIVISLTYHLAHVKTEYKGAATTSPFSLHTAPPPCIIHLHYEVGGHGFSSFSRPPFHPSFCSQEVVVFWQQCHWDQNCKSFLLIQRG